ncbi:transposase [Microbacterium sp. A94]
MEAAPGGSTGTDVADEVGVTEVYRLLTDEQWRAISSIVHPDDHPRRGRPSADARTVVNAILYRDATSIPWRELPSTFGSWRTVVRRYGQWLADGSWDEVGRLLSQSDGGGLPSADPTP